MPHGDIRELEWLEKVKNVILKFLVFIITGAFLGALAGYVQQCAGSG